MKFGIFVNTNRPDRSPAQTVEEDLWEIVAADRLGFEEAWISEHHWPAELLIAQAAKFTHRIRLGSGVRPLPFYHPLQIALEANMCDQITNGRYMLGCGVGGPASAAKMRQWGALGEDAEPHLKMCETIELIVRALRSDTPFDFFGQFWQGKDISLPVRSVQPLLPVALANMASVSTSELAGRLGLMSLRFHFSDPQMMTELTRAYLAAATTAGHELDPEPVRASRFVWVADSTPQAKEELRARMAPFIHRRTRKFPAEFRSILPPGGTADELTWDDIVDSGHFFVGDPDRVAELIDRHHAACGGYGVFLLLAGWDIGDRIQRERSMTLFAEAVMPQLS